MKRICDLQLGEEFILWTLRRQVSRVGNGFIYYRTWNERKQRFATSYESIALGSKQKVIVEEKMCEKISS